MTIVPDTITTHNQLGRFGEEYVWRELRDAGKANTTNIASRF